MDRRSLRAFSAVLATVCVIAACSGGESTEETAATADAADAGEGGEGGEDAAEAAAAPATSTAEMTAEASMTVADIDRWQKGMVAELAAVRDAGKQLKAARTGTDSISAIMAANETSTRGPGARAAGVDENRYGLIASTLSSIVRYMVPVEVEMDVKQMPAEMKTAMNQDREQTFARLSPNFPPAVIDALRPRAADLRKQELALTGERLKAAGMVP